MTKEEILAKVRYSIIVGSQNTNRNSMGAREALYNPYFLIGICFKDESKLAKMSLDELNNLIQLAKFASEVFY